MDWSEPIRVGKSAQLVYQRVYLPVGGLDPPLQGGLLVRHAGFGELLCRECI
jgi:hypothetical protein